MRKKIVAGNWKMNNTASQGAILANELTQLKYANDVTLLVIPPAIFIENVIDIFTDSEIKVGAQNCSNHEKGAYTGEISANMIASIGAEYIIVGHSERRAYFNETNQILSEKVNLSLKNKLTPIYCCGEVLDERESNNHFNIIKTQISEGLFHLSDAEIQQCVIAYEPVWAIGTGVTASSEQAQEMHAFIRGILSEKYNTEVAENISILYGGSCKPSNAEELFKNNDVDGGLIGGASLVAEDFIAIANSF
jgi:triosephosphate isomerase